MHRLERPLTLIRRNNDGERIGDWPLLPVGALDNKPPTTFEQDRDWVSNQFAVETMETDTIPSPRAWALLNEYQDKQDKFFDKFYGKVTAASKVADGKEAKNVKVSTLSEVDLRLMEFCREVFMEFEPKLK